MAHHPDYEYDVFISYSHANNHEGWVTKFEEKLIARLRERLSNEVRVFRDVRELQGNELLTPELKRAVERSVVFLPIVSRNYLTRPWCTQECETFRAADPNWAGRVFPVRYDAVKPVEFQQRFGGDMLGYSFFGAPDATQAASEFDPESKEFKHALLKLRDDIGSFIESRMAKRRDEPAANGLGLPTTGLSTANSTPQNGSAPVILLAESPPVLTKQRDELLAFLRGSKIEVLQTGAGFHEPEGYAARFDALLNRADLVVQLLGRQFLPHDDEVTQSWDRWQYQRATTAGKSIQRWFLKYDKEGRELDLARLDATHREFVTLAGTWDCDFQRFKQIVVEDAQRRAADRRERNLAAEGERPLIVIRSDKSDREFADEVGSVLNRLHCETIRVPEKDMTSLEDFAKDVTANGLVVVYRACPGRWVLKRLQELRGFLRSDLGRRWTCGLWNDPVDDDDPLSCKLDGLVVIDPQDERTLEQFVANLRQLGRQEVTS